MSKKPIFIYREALFNGKRMTEAPKGFDPSNIEGIDTSRYRGNKPPQKKEDLTVHKIAKKHLASVSPEKETKQKHLIKPQDKDPSLETVKKRILPKSIEQLTTSLSPVQYTPKELQHIVETSLIPSVPLPWMSKKTFSIDERMADLGIPGLSIAVINNGKIEWAKGYGELVEPHLLSQIGSISKTFTSLTVLSLIEQSRKTALHGQPSGFVEGKRIDLDTDVREILGEKLWSTIDPNKLSEDRDHTVTIRRLLSHTAGIVPGGAAHINLEALDLQISYLQNEIKRLEESIQPNLPYSEREALDPSLILKREKLTFLQKLRDESKPCPTLDEYLQGKSKIGPICVTSQPGDRFDYSNPGYAILQKAVEIVTGEPFAETIQKRVLNPLEMDQTTFKPSIERTVHGNTEGIPLDGLFHQIPEAAAGGIWSNAQDMAKFIAGLHDILTGKSTLVLHEIAQEMIASPIEGNYALGILVEREPSATYFGHRGGTPGFRTNFLINNQGSGAVILTNSEEGLCIIPEIERSICETYNWADKASLPCYGSSVQPEELSTVNSENWVQGPSGFGGHYVCHEKDENHTVDIVFKQNKIWLDVDGGKTQPDGTTFELIPLGEKIACYRKPPAKPYYPCRFFEENGKLHLNLEGAKHTRLDPN